MSFQFSNQYRQAFDKLNAEQREAVDLIDGPVLVLAGPGTGKTQILASRIGRILEQTDSKAHNILCLTYTDAGTIAMRDRLKQFIGPEAYNVPIFTFHGFCNSVILENKELFNFFNDVQALDELERIEVLREIIDSFPQDHILKRHKGAVYYDLKGLDSLFQYMKKEHLSANDIISMVNDELESLRHDDSMYYKRNGKGFKKGDFKQRDFEKVQEKLSKTVAASVELDHYRDLLRQRGRYDYQDMINFVIDAFESVQDLLLDYQERYQYILVDEYQDTNGAQNRILDLLCNFWEKPNVFVVGDDDQSIYGFQGANLRGVREFHAKYDPSLIILDKNYRSTQAILDSSQSVISNNSERLINYMPNLSKKLISNGPYLNDESRPVIMAFSNKAAEEVFILEELRQLKEEKKIKLSDVAVLYRNHRDIENVISVLEKENFAINVRKKVNILDEPLIKNILSILRYIVNESQEPFEEDFGLSEILFFPFVGLSKKDLNSLFYQYNKSNTDPSRSLRRFIQVDLDPAQLENFEDIERLSNLIDSCIEWYHSETPQILLERIIDGFGVFDWFWKIKGRSWQLQLLNTLFEHFKEVSSKEPELSLSKILDQLDRLQEENVGLPIHKILQNQEGVHFVTCHSSKGLEFERVYMIGLNADNWEKKRTSYYGFRIPSPDNKQDEKEALIEENRRLFFVGMTRAKKDLFLTYAKANNNGKQIERTRYIEEALQTSCLEVEQGEVLESKLLYYLEEVMSRKVVMEDDFIDREIVDEVMSTFSMSVTSLNKYLSCPIAFYFENILRVPQARKTYLGYGNAIHQTLEDAVNLYRKRDGDMDESQLLNLYERHLYRFASHFTKEQYANHLYIGKETLKSYFETYKHEWLQPDEVLFEFNAGPAQVNDVLIKGKLDKVERTGTAIKVVDYKTGKFKAASLKPYENEDVIGGDYWRQIVFYKLLIDHSGQPNWNFDEGILDFVEKDSQSNKYHRKSLSVSFEDEQIVKEQISNSYLAMKNYEFTTGCNKEHCHWCDRMKFSVENQMS